ncbi:HAMP domain-containing histidine kinase [Maridesulfovibrio zosterae]|uniref:HAMP domain-containing histidine kinase n=1 Tax=Maridesulfovibrio zosterae TaxID=82171 RepID=UPI0003F4FD77|nr:HAMP domain-containing histidine kinase [Maridesulfovibrio zosterae]
MESTTPQKDRDGLCFFGQISAAISHDLKNVLAIINEDAGLMQDYLLMANQGMEINPDKLGEIAGKILIQIKRGDSIIKNMNRFAHSVDLPECEVDYRELTLLVVSLLTRIASRKSVTISIAESDPVKGKGDPFVIQMLIAKCLEICIDSAGKDNELNIEFSNEAGNSAIKIIGLSNPVPADQLSGLEKNAVNVGASLGFSPQDKILIIKF